MDNSGMKKTLATMLLWLCCSTAWSFDDFTVRDIEVEGLQRISLGTVFNYMPVRVGETVDQETAEQIIQRLYKTDFFENIELYRLEEKLVVVVTERPAVAEINLDGNKLVSDEDLELGLKSIGLSVGKVFDPANLEQISRELHDQYFAQGHYGVRIKSTVRHLERNRVALDISLSEGKVASIQEINIIGNREFSESVLLKKFQLSASTFWSFLSSNDQYSDRKLAADLETLRAFYMNNGFARFSVDSTQVSISPDKRQIFITINVSEGHRYQIRSVSFSGQTIVPKSELKDLLTTREGDNFSRADIVTSLQVVGDKLADKGYAFAEVTPMPEIDDKRHTVDLSYDVNPGQRVYIRRIVITGNTRTKDEVIRREMRQMEGAWYAKAKVRQSIVRLERLSYFSTVDVDISQIPGSNDLVDLLIQVEETSTGSFTAGLGYAAVTGSQFTMNLRETNFFGSGNTVNIEANINNAVKQYDVSYTDPYFTIWGQSLGLGFYNRQTDASQLGTGFYNRDALGLNVHYGYPLSEDHRIRAGVSVDQSDLSCNSLSFAQAEGFEDIDGCSKTHEKIAFSVNWTHDTRNQRFLATDGLYQTINAEVTLPLADLQYYKVNAEHQWFMPLSDQVSLMFKGILAFANGYGSGGELPFYERYYAGGLGTVRGFVRNQLGPRYTSLDRPRGGELKMTTTVELILPIPFVEDSRNVRLSAFWDAGNVFATHSDFDVDELRMATGLSLSWWTPIGPLSWVLARPLNAELTDETERFDFTIGVPF
jgi:outer membrane protein insertion porin family